MFSLSLFMKETENAMTHTSPDIMLSANWPENGKIIIQ